MSVPKAIRMAIEQTFDPVQAHQISGPPLMSDAITVDQLRASIGGEPRTSSWLTIDQPRIDTFADVTEDHQFIHIDVERAKLETPFGGTIAHGFLTLSVLSSFAYETRQPIRGAVMGINYGLNNLRFLNPVKAGARVRAHFTILAVEDKGPGRILTTTGVSVEIEGEEKPALVAEWLGMTILG
jgi:acyl dehydratase